MISSIFEPHQFVHNKSCFDKKSKPLIQSLFERGAFDEALPDFNIDLSYESKEEESSPSVQNHMEDFDPYSSNPGLLTKRKSECWDSRPLEPESEDSLFSPSAPALDDMCYFGFEFDLMEGPSSSSSNNGGQLPLERFRIPAVSSSTEDPTRMFQPRPGGLDFEMEDFDTIGMGFDDKKQKKKKKKKQGIAKARHSEDWSSTSKLKRSKSLPEDISDQSKRRVKWTDEELRGLWNGILSEGNNWKEISKKVTTRSYFQIKDKGRRLLFLRGWTTGRNKNDTDDGNRKAKAIAKDALTEIKQ